jgi:uncharacterized protein
MSDVTTTSQQIQARERTKTLFGQTMGLVAATTGVFAVGAYFGRNLPWHVGLLSLIGSLVVLIAMRRAVTTNPSTGVPLLMVFGLVMGIGMGPTLEYYANMDPAALWTAGAATTLFMCGFGLFGYATRRDLSAIARVAFFGLIGLIVAGVVLIFVHMPAAWVLYSLLGLVIFAALTAYDFQRLRKARDINEAPLLAASIFLDALNVFMMFLRLFGGR